MSKKGILLKETRANFYVFLQAYKVAREQNGLIKVPPYDASTRLRKETVPRPESFLSPKIEEIYQHFLKKFLELDPLFRIAYENISCQKSKMESRRRRVFLKRYLGEESIQSIAQEESCSESLVKIECNKALIQFCFALGIVVIEGGD